MRRLLAGIGVAGALALLAAPTASAVVNWPQEFGDRCTATGAEPGVTAIVVSNGLGLSAFEFPPGVPPEGAVVITRWKVNAPAALPPTPQQLVAFGYRGGLEGPVEFVPIGESSLETVVGGAPNEFTTRIPVSEGNSIGLRGPGGALVCAAQAEPPAHSAGFGPNPWANGEARQVKFENETGVPVIAAVEYDRDGDGYGDQSQDKCPEEPRLHTPCPIVHPLPRAKAFKRGIALEVSTGDPARVEVSGQVGWGYRPKGGGPKKRLVVGLPGGSQEVGSGATVGFWLPLPPRVIERREKLTLKEELKAHLWVVATDVLGHQSLADLTVKLPGWAKPVHGQRPTR